MKINFLEKFNQKYNIQPAKFQAEQVKTTMRCKNEK